MATFLIETSVDYSDQQIAEVDFVRFLDFTGSGTVTATFHLSQFTNSEPFPPPTIVITGGNGRNHLVLNVEDREGFENFRFLAANLQFDSWTSKDRVTIYGGLTGEEIRGTRVNDKIYGGAGDDEIRSDDGRDTIFGGSGDDTLSMFSGNDQVFGGSGTDTVQLSATGSVVNIDMATGSGAVGDRSFSGCEVLDISFFNSSGTVAGADGNDTVAVYSEDSVIFSGGAGDDRFYVSTADLPPTGSFDGGDGVDTINVDEVAYEDRATVGAVSVDISDGGGGRDIGWGFRYPA